MKPEIAVAGLTKKYGACTAIDALGFEVAPGTIFGLLGPNGAGKTTALECLLGLRAPDAGSVHLAGIDVLAEPARARDRVGVALQATALPDRLTPREALRLFGAFYAHSVRPEALLERFSLRDKADAPYDSLSAGQKQRLALALAFVNEPSILFLDEPTAGLDPQARRELHQAILRLREEGCTILLTTHYLDEAHALCDRLAILRRGRIVAAGSPAELIARHPAPTKMAVRTAQPIPQQLLENLPGIGAIEFLAGEVQFQVENVGRGVVAIVNLLEKQGNELLDLRVWRPSLEDTFLELTGEQAPL